MTGAHTLILNPDLQRVADVLIGTLVAAEYAARGSGRTTRVLERSTADHRLIAPVAAVQHRLISEAKALNIALRKVIVADPRHPLYAGPNQAVVRDGTWPTLPDHSWVEARIRHLVLGAISQVQYELDQVDLPQTPAERQAQRQNYLAREAGAAPGQAYRIVWPSKGVEW